MSAAVAVRGIRSSNSICSLSWMRMKALKAVTRESSTEALDKESRMASFGFKRMPVEDKQRAVNKVFASVAEKYDLMNDLMSMGLHRLWKREFVAMLDAPPSTRLLDVASGTGDIAEKFIEQQRSRGHHSSIEKVTVCDISAAMLEEGRKRAKKTNIGDLIEWVEADARDLPFEDSSFDAYTITFGIRNVAEVEKALREALRVLAPGGRFLCMEFSQPVLPLLDRLYDQYSFQVIPALGEVVAGDRDSYQYLVESIREFPNQETFLHMIREAGFTRVNYTNFTAGIVAVHSAFKPWN